MSLCYSYKDKRSKRPVIDVEILSRNSVPKGRKMQSSSMLVSERIEVVERNFEIVVLP